MKRTASDISTYVMSSSSLQSRQDSVADFNLISRNAVKFKAAQVYLPKDVNGPSFYTSTQSEAKVESSNKSTQKVDSELKASFHSYPLAFNLFTIVNFICIPSAVALNYLNLQDSSSSV
jgi:hypothetical protein